MKARGQDWWADPARTKKGEINRNDGGRGVYFLDPCEHVLEILTRPYGGQGIMEIQGRLAGRDRFRPGATQLIDEKHSTTVALK